MLSDKIELRSAAARLLYGNNRDSADYDMLVDYIDSSELVQHAVWLRLTNYSIVRYCSLCSTRHIVGMPNKYCPNCGAKMDGGADND